MSELKWLTPNHSPLLTPSDVHVWRARLDETENLEEEFLSSLSQSECEVASKFFFRRDRDRYAASRGILRQILSRYLSMPPQEIRILHGENGKPYLGNNPLELEFNLSHSQNLALFVFTIRHRIGIDIEYIFPLKDCEQIANSFMSPTELVAFKLLPREIRLKAFYNTWTRKEAFVKALGIGITNSLERFEVSVNPSDKPSLKNVHPDLAIGSRWHLIDVQPASGYSGTLAIDADEVSLQLFDFYFD